MFLESTTPDTWNIVISVLLMIVAYLCGSFPSGVVVGKALTGTDIRQRSLRYYTFTNPIEM